MVNSGQLELRLRGRSAPFHTDSEIGLEALTGLSGAQRSPAVVTPAVPPATHKQPAPV